MPVKKGNFKVNLIAAFDVGKNTGYSFRIEKWSQINRESTKIKFGSGSPFEVAEKLKEFKNADEITLVFYYDMSFLGPQTTVALERYKRYIIDPVLFKGSKITIQMYQESVVFRAFTRCMRAITSKEKKELTMKECQDLKYDPANYDEADALQLLVYYINFKNRPPECEFD